MIATEIVDTILDDLEGRKGVGDELDQIDEDVLDDLRRTLVEKTTVVLERELQSFTATTGQNIKGLPT